MVALKSSVCTTGDDFFKIFNIVLGYHTSHYEKYTRLVNKFIHIFGKYFFFFMTGVQRRFLHPHNIYIVVKSQQRNT